MAVDSVVDIGIYHNVKKKVYLPTFLVNMSTSFSMVMGTFTKYYG